MPREGRAGRFVAVARIRDRAGCLAARVSRWRIRPDIQAVRALEETDEECGEIAKGTFDAVIAERQGEDAIKRAAIEKCPAG